MRRIILSIILGIVFPFVCFMSLGFASMYMPPSVLTDIRIRGQMSPGILFAPFSIPIYLDVILNKAGLLPDALKTFSFRVASLIIFNWILYGIIIYMLLGRLKRFKKQPAAVSETPPAPPEFEQKD